MAFRSSAYLKPILNRLRGTSSFATSTATKMKSYAPTTDSLHYFQDTKTKRVGDMVPLYVALGLIMLQVGFGLNTVVHLLARSPNVHLNKSRRETLPELVDPDLAVEEGDKFIKKSFFRKVAQIQELGHARIVPDSITAREPRAETLKSVGVDPKAVIEVEKMPGLARLESKIG